MIGTKFDKPVEDLQAYSAAAEWCNTNGAIIEDKGEYYEVVEIPKPTLAELKSAKLQEAGAEFANRRDSVRFIKVSAGTYGFDAAVDDITNFMASWKAAEIAGETLYKVWLNDTEKGLAQLTLADFTTVFNAVRQSQYEDYAWYEQTKSAIEACQTAEELNKLLQ
ncbi:MAG: hypothetical protein SPI35_08145 [Porphyromonas sp.]|nr:hypothetical protein [Porphyromonas sp.]